MVVVVQVGGGAHGRLYDTLYQSAARCRAHPTAQQMLLPFAEVQPQLILNVRRQLLTVHLRRESN